MTVNKNKPEIALPRGVSDFLPDTASKIGYIESRIRRVFELWGFRRVITPKLEYEDILSLGMGDGLKGKTYRFDDRQSGRLLAFPPDITPQIARIVATRLSSSPLPHRISYSGRVLRQTEMQAGRSREIFQSGVELIGLDSPEADAELVVMAIEILKNLGFDKFKIDLGQVEFCRGIIASSGLQGKALEDLQQAVTSKDSSAVAQILETVELDDATKLELTALPRLFGGVEIVEDAKKIVKNKRSVAAIENLSQVLEILDIHGVTDFLTVDLGETRGLDYHTGVTFEGFVCGLGEAVCSGGRYDLLTARYGFESPATGFTFNVLNLLQALQSSPELATSTEVDFLLFNRCHDRKIVLNLARSLRALGYTVARDIIRREYDDSLCYASQNSIRFMLLVEEASSGKDSYTAVRVRDGKKVELGVEEIQSKNIIEIIEKNLGDR